MSFYGSIYYQATDAIAKVIIKNSGINDRKFLTGDLPEFVQLDADGRSSELRIDSGNRWIRLEGVDEENRCSIYHGEPDHSTQDFINIINKGSVEEDETGETIIEEYDTILDVTNGVRFTVPLIYYDKAGHVSLPKNDDGEPMQLMQTFVMPKIMTAKEIDALKARMDDIEANDLEQDKNIETALDDASTAKTTANSTSKTLQDFLSSYNEQVGIFKADISDLQSKLQTLEGANNTLLDLYGDLAARVSALEKA